MLLQCLSDQQIISWLTEEASVKNCDKYQKHLDTCNKCRIKQENWKNFISMAQSVSVIEPHPLRWDTYNSKVLEKIRRSDKQSWFTQASEWINSYKWGMKSGMIAGIVALIILINPFLINIGMKQQKHTDNTNSITEGIFDTQVLESIINTKELETQLAMADKLLIVNNWLAEVSAQDLENYLTRYYPET